MSVGTARQARSGSKRSRRRRRLRAADRHELRQEVSEPIGLGQSFHRERSRWEEPTRDLRVSDRPLTREVSTGRLTQVGPAIRSSAHRRKAMTAESIAAPAGDRGCGAAELGRSWSCSRIAHGCRSRQAACGHSRPRAKSAWITSRGLAPRRESACEVKERRKPGRRGKAAITVAGSPSIESKSVKALFGTWTGKRANALQRAPVDGRRLGSYKPLS